MWFTTTQVADNVDIWDRTGALSLSLLLEAIVPFIPPVHTSLYWRGFAHPLLSLCRYPCWELLPGHPGSRRRRDLLQRRNWSWGHSGILLLLTGSCVGQPLRALSSSQHK